MTSTAVTDPELFRIDIAEDKLSAMMQLRARDKDLSPTKEQIVEALQKHKVVIDEAVERKIEAFLAPTRPFVVAEGTPPVEGHDEELLWDPVYDKTAQDWQGDAPVNYYTSNSIITLAKGASIGSIKPLVESVDGVDIFGRPIPAKTKPRRLQWDNTIRQDHENPSQLVAAVAGRVVEKECALSINEVLTVDGDVDFESCNIDATSEVEITGTVGDRFAVKCAKSVTIGGAIEAAEVLAGNNIVVRGGILGRGEGRVDAGGDITARFGDDADLQAKGNIKVCSQLMNCRTRADGLLQADLGAIIGGYHYAREGISVSIAGSEGYKPTRVAIGIHPRVLKQVEEIERGLEAKRKSVEKIRSTVQPLMADFKRLTAAQKEQATELLFKADEAEMEITEALAERDRILQAGRAKETPRLLVAQVIYPAVTISIGYRLHTFSTELRGSYSIEVRKVNEVTEMVAVNRPTGSVQILNSRTLTPDELLEGFEMGQPANTESVAEGDGEAANSPD